MLAFAQLTRRLPFAAILSILLLAGGPLLLTGCPAPTPDGVMNDNGDSGGDNTSNDNSGGGNGGAGNDNSGGNNDNGTGGGGNDNSGGGGSDNGSGSNDNGASANDNGGGSANDNGGGSGNDNSAANDNGSSGNDNSSSNGNANSNDNGGGNALPPTSIELVRVAQTGDVVPGQPSARFTDFGNPVIDSKGRVAFWARYTGGNGHGGLYVFDAGQLKRVVDDDTTLRGVVPGRDDASYFGDFAAAGSFNPLNQALAWGGGDRLLFNSETNSTPTSVKSRGIYRWRATDGNMVRVADLEQLAALFPNTSARIFSSSWGLPCVSDAGIAVFAVGYTYFTLPPNSTTVSGQGVFSSNGTTVSVVRDRNLSPAGTVPDQGTRARFSGFSLLVTHNAGGDFLLQGEYDSGNGFTGVYQATGSQLFRAIDGRDPAAWPGLALGAQVDPDGETFKAISIGPNRHIAIQTQLLTGVEKHDTVLLWDPASASWRELVGAAGTPASILLSGVNDDGQALVLAGDRPFLASRTGSLPLDTALPAGLSDPVWSFASGALNNNGRALVRYNRGSANGAPGYGLWTGERMLIVADGAAGLPASDVFTLATVSSPERDRPGRSGAINDRDEATFRVQLRGPDNTGATADDVIAIYIGRGK